MKAARIPDNEQERLKVLNKYRILDSLPEEEYDAITKLASFICETPIALVSVIDADRQWFKSNHGIDVKETHRNYAFCAHSILNPGEIFEVEDAKKDDRFFDNPLTINSPNVVFYAGAPLNTSEGFPLGTLCVIDSKPKKLTDSQREALTLLADQVVSLLELRKKNFKLKEFNKEILHLNDILNGFAYKLTHDLKAPLQNVDFLFEALKEDAKELLKNKKTEEYINLISNRLEYMNNLIVEMLSFSTTTNKKLEYSNFNLKELLESIIKNIDIENNVEIDTTQLNVNINSSKIGFLQIFQNLISNSKKFTDEKKVVIEVDFFETKKMYNFVYSDNGPGILKKYWEKVFHLFETTDETDEKNTGIGLANVKATVERLGGNIYTSKRKDGKKGVCFTFSIEKK